MKEMFPLWSMGETAEEVASLLKILEKTKISLLLNLIEKLSTQLSLAILTKKLFPLKLKKKRNNNSVKR